MTAESRTYPRDETGAEILQGDLVFYDGAVWKVHEIGQILGGYNLTLFNQNNGYKEGVIPQATTALGADTVSGACPKCGGHPEPKKVEDDDDDEEDDEDDRPPQSIIVAPTAEPLFPQFVFKPGDKVFREMKSHRGYYWREGTVISLEPHRDIKLDPYYAKLVVKYTNGNGSEKVGYWPVKEVRREAPPIMRVEPHRTDITYASDRWQDDYFGPYRGRGEFSGGGGGKTDSISRADLISQEARRLANEDRRSGIMRPEKQSKEAPKIGTKLKTRKGEW